MSLAHCRERGGRREEHEEPQEGKKTMTLHGIAHFAHRVLHKHTRTGKDGVGVIETCELRLPRSRVHVAFRPDFSEAGWYYVPAVHGEDGTLLLTRIFGADNAWHAMALLRAAYSELENR